MKVLALDPGPKETAAVVWDGSAIEWMGDQPNATIPELFGLLHVDAVACEHLQCFGMSVGQETFETAYTIGFYRAWAEMSGLPFHRVYRSEVKMTLCGNMRAKDGNIRQALIDMIGPQGKKKAPGPTYGVSNHRWAALAIGVTFLKRAEQV